MVHLFKNKKNSIKKNYLFNLIFLFLAFLIFSYGIAHIYTNKFFSNYSFSELFINYQAGFVRRGLFGEIFWQTNSFFAIDF